MTPPLLPEASSSPLLEEAFLFGFPLVFNLDQVDRYVRTGIGSNPAAPFNTWSHARTLAGPEDTFVSINNDTLYSMAQLDLGVGPILLRTPDTGGKYFVLQFVDAWTNNFAYVGHRATGTAAQDFLIVPPGWSGETPEGVTVIQAPTRVCSIVGRWACSGDADLPRVHALQDAISLTPVDAEQAPEGLPVLDGAVPEGLLMLEKFRVWSQAFPVPEHEQATLGAFGPLGVLDGGPSPYTGLDAAVSDDLAARLASCFQELVAYLRNGDVPEVNGWQLAYHAFDYNIDFFEIGTVNTPLFTSIPQELRYRMRAAAALGGLWGNHAYEAAYAAVYTDEQGEQLLGERTYTLTLTTPPPARAFWSLTMYSVPDFYLVANDINRFSIGSETAGLRVGEDGSLVITMSAKPPQDPADRANWLPAPEGAFRPLMRMYEPDDSVVTGAYKIPAIVRAQVQSA